MRRCERLLERSEGLPAAEDEKTCEAADERADDFRIAGWEGRGVDDADEDEGRGEDEEEGADVV